MVMPSKGVRVQATLRIPADLHRAAVRGAHSNHRSLNDYICGLLRDAHPNAAEPVGTRQQLRVYDDDGQLIGRV
jgi:hypothetical protein